MSFSSILTSVNNRTSAEDFLVPIGNVKFSQVWPILVIALVVLSSMVVVLRGLAPATPQASATEIDGLKYISSIDAITLGEPVWVDNFTDISSWKVTRPGNSSLKIDNALNLTAYFSPNSTAAQSVQIYRSVNISLNLSPIMISTVVASKGIHYGIRFSGVDPYGDAFDAWYESSPLQHRPRTRSERKPDGKSHARILSYERPASYSGLDNKPGQILS